MPQDELWATSARLTGLQLTLDLPGARTDGLHRLTVVPRWSKTPSGRSGYTSLMIPDYAIWSLPELTTAVWEQFLGGDSKHMSSVVSSKLKYVLLDYREGVRS